jgi:hypothetical protein
MLLCFVTVCDPVMGDEGKLYVPEELVPAYRDKVHSCISESLFLLSLRDTCSSCTPLEASGLESGHSTSYISMCD